MYVSKAIIPAAGLGTRFLPATKAQPKEMLPIAGKPAIQYIVEEAAASGIEDIIIISGRGKRAIEDHFDKSYELEETLAKQNRHELLEAVEAVSNLASIHYVRQKEPKGLGDAIYCARSYIGDEPFAVMLGDDVVQGERPCLSELLQAHQQYGGTVVGVQEVAAEELCKYGVVEPEKFIDRQLMKLKSLVEKPPKGLEPSSYALMGRYILPPEIFSILETLPAGANKEVQLTDAIRFLAGITPVYGVVLSGSRYDIGDRMGFLKANIEMAMLQADIRTDLIVYLEKMLMNRQGAAL
ncbi:UTP--glucose-1-phosphate uridylyltransferase GalU [Bacillus sp. UMB0728]|uniref:UTP--glucose-1-phosphate uridylyltransferase GalU n=1 Tax=Bacillus sp. UMB0728 TaxID=2066052 RepID=UPI000C78EBB3|nr:UTP--glucose-1-phosphate uridylyltransferase GalU [Bacillus sp. UMB0728]PLR73358.1 UTP--glucose-1-phosphate uridylyltransferase [Bacillus sp. UMB0728]